mgnify:CR=1 FL=1
MDFFDLLKMVGGLALFLYGMNLLGDGLSQASGGRLERILEKLTSNPIKAVLMGAVVTGDYCYGSRLCQFRHYEPETGSGHYHGRQYRYHGDLLDLKPCRH